MQFDLVLFMGGFYHLRYPMLGLDIGARLARRVLVCQTLTMPGTDVYPDVYGLDIDNRQPMLEAGWPKMAFIEAELVGDPTNWWEPNHACVEALLRACGMQITTEPGHEIYICAPDPAYQSTVATWDNAEFLAATEQPWLKIAPGERKRE